MLIASVPGQMRTPVLSFLAMLVLLCGCGGGDDGNDAPSPAEQAEQGQPVLGQRGDEEPAGPALGFPVFATKNTTRVGGADPVADAAGVAQAVFPSRSEDTRPPAVVLVDQDDWRAGIAASQLMAPPLRAPILLTEGADLPEATADALDKLQPTGSKEAGDAQVIRIGDVAEPDDLKSTDVAGGEPVGGRAARSTGCTPPRPAVLRAACSWPRPTGRTSRCPPRAGRRSRAIPVLWTGRDELPAETRTAIEAHKRPRIYVLGPGGGHLRAR